MASAGHTESVRVLARYQTEPSAAEGTRVGPLLAGSRYPIAAGSTCYTARWFRGGVLSRITTSPSTV